MVRPDDLLLLRLEFVSVDFTAPSAGAPAQIAGQANARLVVHFQPQHILEQAFWEVSDGTKPKAKDGAEPGQPLPPSPPPGNDPLPPPGMVLSRLAGPSRLAFNVPAGTKFPLTVEGVLAALETLPLNVTAVARYEPRTGCMPPLIVSMLQPPPQIVAPSRFETAIELPYRLFLSPDHQATWTHAEKPVEHDGRIELWHTRLGTRRPDNDPRVRAVWSPDFQRNPQDHALVPFRASLDGRDRNEIVQLTSNYYIDAFAPVPVETSRMMLTTLGGWLDVHGQWNPPLVPADPPDLPAQRHLTVSEWNHVATMGRDHFVRVVYEGYLFPLGHRASLVKITERKFFFRKDVPKPGFIAYDFQRMFIKVREHRRTYMPRDFQFRTVDIITETTPNLAKPEDSEVIAGKNQDAFWPRIDAGDAIADFPFHVIGYEWEGRAIDFTMPLIFVSLDIDTQAAEIQKVLDAYAGLGPKAVPLTSERRRRPLNGQHVAFAPSGPPDRDNDSTLQTNFFTFAAKKVDGSEPHFRPLMAKSEVDIPAVQQLLGRGVSSTIEWEPSYTNKLGTSIGNPAQVFARVTNTPPLNFDTDKSGGLVAPNIGVSGLSRSLGPVGGPVDLLVNGAEGSFDPEKIFGEVKLLGGIKLSDIIRIHKFADAGSTGDNSLPKFLTVRDGNVVRTTYHWSLPASELIPSNVFKPNGSTFTLDAVVEKRLDTTTPPVLKTTGTLTSFAVVLLPPKDLHLVELTFNSIGFVAETGKKLDTSVDFGGIKFVGILEFVNKLQSFIPSDGFKDPPSIELLGPPDPGVNVGFSLGLPTIGVGVMTMQNVSLSALFYLPFGAKPMNFRFAFCERQQPFILTVSLFGGGGFFAIKIGLDGVEDLEASLEFGASIALNLGVASGSATIMAGFYFHMTKDGFELTGYLRACGSLSVLGIITVSIEFYLGLTYATKAIAPHGGHLWGQASVTVKISILFFSISVGVTLEREFAGSDPTFRQLMPFGAWTDYCGAFDDYPVVAGE
ncbi:MAG: hypothetical protein DMF56_15760 [Acidobacteria bacterium]|nr:MAG: hypothetical protein DMF56_15760 [Acidobacteriota bacterium]